MIWPDIDLTEVNPHESWQPPVQLQRGTDYSSKTRLHLEKMKGAAFQFQFRVMNPEERVAADFDRRGLSLKGQIANVRNIPYENDGLCELK